MGYDIEIPSQGDQNYSEMGLMRTKRNTGAVDSIPLNATVCRALQEWLDVRPKKEHFYLFISQSGTPMSSRAIQEMVRVYMNTVGLKNASVRTLRHTMATHHAFKGTDIDTLKDVLGHKSTKTTERYYLLADKLQRKELQKNSL